MQHGQASGDNKQATRTTSGRMRVGDVMKRAQCDWGREGTGRKMKVSLWHPCAALSGWATQAFPRRACNFARPEISRSPSSGLLLRLPLPIGCAHSVVYCHGNIGPHQRLLLGLVLGRAAFEVWEEYRPSRVQFSQRVALLSASIAVPAVPTVHGLNEYRPKFIQTKKSSIALAPVSPIAGIRASGLLRSRCSGLIDDACAAHLLLDRDIARGAAPSLPPNNARHVMLKHTVQCTRSMRRLKILQLQLCRSIAASG